jgi:hypothetical protein
MNRTRLAISGNLSNCPLFLVAAFLLSSATLSWSQTSTNIIGSLSVGDGNSLLATNSVAIGLSNTVSGNNSLAVGASSQAGGSNSFAAGASTAAGGYAAALNGSVANGNFSLAANMGQATNTISVALGYGTVTGSPMEMVVGLYNRNVGNGESVLSSVSGYYSITDATAPLFVVGNGSPSSASNALQVRKDGMVLINPSGDLSMGSYTNGPIP